MWPAGPNVSTASCGLRLRVAAGNKTVLPIRVMLGWGLWSTRKVTRGRGARLFRYLNEKTGEMFHDIEDFREKVQKIVKNADVPGYYEPQKWVTERYGDQHSAKRLCDWVKAEFSDRVKLPEGTTMLYPSGA